MIEDLLIMRPSSTSDNTAYTLRLRLALRDIAPFGRNAVYAGNVRRTFILGHTKQE